MELIEPLEKLVQSDVMLLMNSTDGIVIRVAKDENGRYNIGLNSGSLTFSYEPGKTFGGSPLIKMIACDSGVTAIALQNRTNYIIHNKPETLETNLQYDEVPSKIYMNRMNQLMREKSNP